MSLISANSAHCLSKTSRQENISRLTEKVSELIEKAAQEGKFACECFFSASPIEIESVETEILPQLITLGYGAIFSRT
ncbi:MAG: hypothetical protein RR371_04290, partial [Bacteroides sp.]